jgi:transposase-like protein
VKSRRKFTKEFKQTAVNRLNTGQSAAEVARALEVHSSDLHRWRRELQEHGERAFSGAGRNGRKKAKSPNSSARSVSRRWRSIFKASLAGCRGAAPAAGTEQRRGFYEQVEKEVKTGTRMSVLRMCEVAGFSRAGYYRFVHPVKPAPGDMDLRDEIQKIALQCRRTEAAESRRN